MVRVGLAGYASAGRGIHAPIIREAGLELAAVATSNPDRRAEVAQDFPDALVVDDLDALLAVEGLDVIVLATPSGSHLEHALKVIEAGIACVVDKPLAVTADDCLTVVDAASHAGVPLTVFHNRRYDPSHTTLATVVADRLAGEPFRCELRWERWRPVPKDRWRENASAAEGGGIMLDLHAHLIDSAVQLFGPVLTVFATVQSHTTPAEDDAFLVCRHESGVVSHLGATSVSGAAGPRVRLLGSDAAYIQNEFEGEPNVYADLADADADHCGWLMRALEREAVPTTPASQVDFYRAVGSALSAPDPQAAMPVDPRDAIHTLAVIDAARASAEGERVVEVITPGLRPGHTDEGDS
ncbi:putative oxidoreductase [Janibacter sp. HTCC2649]|uniref:Gfo/Idh/MocA family protein n=1 Tax=Janibacter sp. HTCC2649 TaxID=313589 RepID=UPI000066EA4F|nr:Gfo/Idh/MocA family oxidoreductase [Janibacter sp. HTCC2649]EAP98753.1 putative oxidoreductase [Janibacter sp. HTCC2649]